MAQFTPSKKTIKDFNDGEEYLNRIDVVQADTVNNLVEGLLYAQESGGTTMLTEGREFGKELKDNDYFLDVISEESANKILVMSIDMGTPVFSLPIFSAKEVKLTDVSDKICTISLTYPNK